MITVIYKLFITIFMGDVDQHFMVDNRFLQKIINASELKNHDIVLEVGAGEGALTGLLCDNCKVIAVERDDSLCSYLRELDMHNAIIINANAMDVLQEFEFNKIVSNIPYSISEPLIRNLLKSKIDLAVLTVSEGFAKLLNSMNRIGVMTRAFFKVEILGSVPNTAFSPIPDVKSAIIKLTPKEKPSGKDLLLRELVYQEDKKIRNALIDYLWNKGKTKRKAKELVSKFDNNILNKNVDMLSNDEFKKLCSFLGSLS
jgi:16S rRNA (adenine1518-N6/adenine1519-N6)-dimethyltransferase